MQLAEKESKEVKKEGLKESGEGTKERVSFTLVISAFSLAIANCHA